MNRRQSVFPPRLVIVFAICGSHVYDAGPIFRGDKIRLDNVPALFLCLMVVEEPFVFLLCQLFPGHLFDDLVFFFQDHEPGFGENQKFSGWNLRSLIAAEQFDLYVFHLGMNGQCDV